MKVSNNGEISAKDGTLWSAHILQTVDDEIVLPHLDGEHCVNLEGFGLVHGRVQPPLDRAVPQLTH